MTLTFEAGALEEYREAAHYSEEHFGLGEEFVTSMEASLDLIKQDPERYQPIGQGIRILRMKRFPYYLFYEFDERVNSIRIYAVAHHKRRPFYWKNRLKSPDAS